MSYSPTTSSQPNDHRLESWEIDLAERIVYGFLVEHGSFRTLDVEDLIQECLLHWWRQRSYYSSESGASKKTYMRHVLKKKLLDIKRHERAQKRKAELEAQHLYMLLSDPDEDDLTLADLVTSKEPEWDPEEMLDRSMLKERIREALSLLTDRQQQLAELLRSGASMTEASQMLRIPRPTLYDELQRIQQVFRDSGLEEFLK